MVSSVNTNINSMAAVQALTDIGNSMAMTQAHIQSGLKVGSSADNPAIFTIAQGLRANIGALTAVGDSLATGIATVQGQSAGATSIATTLNTLLQTVTQAQNATGTALAASNATITKALGNIDAFANATTINNVNLLATAGSVSILSNIDGTNTVATTSTASTSTGLGLSSLGVTATGSSTSFLNTVTLGAIAVAGSVVNYTSPTGVTTAFTFVAAGTATGPTQVDVGTTGAAGSATNLQTALVANGITNTSNATAGVITSTGGGSITGSTPNFTTTGGPAAADTFTFVSSAGVSKTFTFGSAVGQVNVGATEAASMSNLTNALNSSGIASVTNATTGILTVAGGTGAFTTAAAGIATTAASTSGAAAIALVNNAITRIGVTLSALGSATTQLQGLSDFTGKLETSFKTSLGAMVDANLSDESAKLASLQTKQSLAIQSLSLANQGPSALLQLFR